MTQYLPAVEVVTGPDPKFAVIWLHGLGADGHDFEPVVEALNLPKTLPTRFVLPHAPACPVTLNGGYTMPSWFDLYSLQSFEELDVLGIRKSAEAIDALIEREIARGIPSERILLAGFSQGGSLALFVALRQAKPLAGIIGLSTFLSLTPALDTERQAVNANLPIFLAHGTFDSTVSYAFGLQTKAWLSSLGHPVEFHNYPMAHAVCPQEIEDIRAWMLKRLN